MVFITGTQSKGTRHFYTVVKYAQNSLFFSNSRNEHVHKTCEHSLRLHHSLWEKLSSVRYENFFSFYLHGLHNLIPEQASKFSFQHIQVLILPFPLKVYNFMPSSASCLHSNSIVFHLFLHEVNSTTMLLTLYFSHTHYFSYMYISTKVYSATSIPPVSITHAHVTHTLV